MVQHRRLALLVPCLAGAQDPDMLEKAFGSADVDGSSSLDLVEFAHAVVALEQEKVVVRERAHEAMVAQQGGLHGLPEPRRRARPLRMRGGSATWSGSESFKHAEFSKAFLNSLGMIWATEIGDKTFFIAAVLAMRHSRCVVFSGAITALAIMTVLSAALGYVLPSLMPRKYTHYASAALFLYFGIRLLRDARAMREDGPSDELVEVEEELGHKKEGAHSSRRGVARVFWQALALTFLAEWGDRSQIATIALAAAKDPVGVTLGGITGHAMCTGLAVVGGRMLASRISERTVACVGGILFLVFSTYAMFFENVPENSVEPSSVALLKANLKQQALLSGSPNVATA